MVKETIKICEILDVELVHETKMKKSKFIEELRKACFDRDEEELRKIKKSKCKDRVNDKFGIQDYMKNKNSKTIHRLFRIKSKIHHLKGNFPSDPRNRKNGSLVCVGCSKTEETNSHVAECDA